jgi:hypothetical protein
MDMDTTLVINERAGNWEHGVWYSDTSYKGDDRWGFSDKSYKKNQMGFHTKTALDHMEECICCGRWHDMSDMVEDDDCFVCYECAETYGPYLGIDKKKLPILELPSQG